jgi:hypothetical protein
LDTKEKAQLDQTAVDQLETTLEPTVKLTPDLINTYHYPGLDMSGIISNTAPDTITLSNMNYPVYNTQSNTGSYTIGATTPGFTFPNTTNISTNPWATTTNSGRIELTGDDADLVINGVSLMDLLRDRLNVMIPNPALEKEWDQLRELGDQYRALEAQLKEQSDMWSKLKSMPPVDPL